MIFLPQTTLADIIPDILPALTSKNPQVKEGALKFLGRCLANASIPIPPAQMKSVTEPLAALLEDGFEGARIEAATCLGTLMKMVGERPLNALMEGLADVRKAKVKEAYEIATVKCKASLGAPPKAGPGNKEAAGKKKAPAVKKNDTVDATVDDGQAPRKPPAKPPAKPAVSSQFTHSSRGFSPHLSRPKNRQLP
jgi:cytoskeleton-associated protein 5